MDYMTPELIHEKNLDAWEQAALEQFYDECKRIYLATQHLIIDCDVDVQNAYFVGLAIEKIKDLSNYTYNSPDGELLYDFTRYAIQVLDDEMSYMWRPDRRTYA